MPYDNENIFARILRGELPAFSIYETDHCLAFLDLMPQSDGHTLVLPKQPAVNLFDLSDESATSLFMAVKTIADAIQKVFAADGIRLMQFNGEAAGQTVFHMHMHIVPCYAGMEPQAHAKHMAESTVLEEQAAKIRAALS